jgi:hypothetical protein
MEKHSEKIEDELKAQVDQYYEKYCDTPAWIDYAIRYVGDGGVIKSMIVETISKLPKEVKKFACEECQFVSVADGICLSLSSARRKWTLVFSEALDARDNAAVARNIAHAWLQHQSSPDFKAISFQQTDEQIQSLITSWGFPIPDRPCKEHK